MMAATAYCWMMERKQSVFRAFPIRSTASGSGDSSSPAMPHWKRKFSILARSSGVRSAARYSFQSLIGRNTARNAPKRCIVSRKTPAKGKGGRIWTNRPRKSLLYQGFLTTEHGCIRVLYSKPQKCILNVYKITIRCSAY